MTHLSIQNMNGVGKIMRRRISPNRHTTLASFGDVDTNPMDESDLGLDPKGLSPNYAPWWRQPPLRPGEVDTQRGTPRAGERAQADSAFWPSSPLTPSNDARDLPNSYTGKPMRNLPRQNYPGSFPHTWIPYEDLKVATGPEMGPTPPGWATVPTSAQVQARAENGGQPVPWVAEDQMTHDISGFSSLHDIGRLRPGWKQTGVKSWLPVHNIHAQVINKMAQYHRASHKGLFGLGQIDPATGADSSGFVTDASLAQAIANDSAGTAAAAAVTTQAAQAQAQGAPPDTVNQIINYGAKAATIGLQAAGVLPKPKPAHAPFSAASSTPFDQKENR